MSEGREVLRRARAADLRALTRLEVRCFDDPWPRPAIVSLLCSPESLVLVLCSDEAETPWGYASFRQLFEQAELLRLGVDPTQRRHGAARRLMRFGLKALEERGVRSCHLEVRRQNTAARRLYRSLGFRTSGRRRRYYPDGSDAVRCEWRRAT